MTWEWEPRTQKNNKIIIYFILIAQYRPPAKRCVGGIKMGVNINVYRNY